MVDRIWNLKYISILFLMDGFKRTILEPSALSAVCTVAISNMMHTRILLNPIIVSVSN